jgi:putative spermidine/putrescine transport system substrate-binding protein
MSRTIDRRTVLKGTVAAAAMMAIARPAIAKTLSGSGELVVYDGGGVWGEAQQKAYFEPFERETGIKLTRNPRVDVGAVRASISAGSPRFDVTILPGGVSPSFERDGLLVPIDYQWFEKEDLDGFRPIPAAKFTCPHIIYSLMSV